MTKKDALKLFEDRKVRTVWNEDQEKWFFSVLDVVGILTDSVNPSDYIKKMKKRDSMLSEGWGGCKYDNDLNDITITLENEHRGRSGDNCCDNNVCYFISRVFKNARYKTFENSNFV